MFQLRSVVRVSVQVTDTALVIAYTARSARVAAFVAALLAVGSCKPSSQAPSPPPTASRQELTQHVKHIVVIYAENRSFDNLFGHFPGANGLRTVVDAEGKPTRAYVSQKDRDGVTVLPTLPKTWSGVTQRGVTPVVTEAQSAGLANAPFAVETAFQGSANATLSTATVTRDLVHRFYQNQMEINGGKNDGFAAWTDAGGLALGNFDYSQSAMSNLAREFVLADNFFQGAFGGSFLNHQYLICACAPEYPNAETSVAKPSIAAVRKNASGNFLPALVVSSRSPASALAGRPVFENDGNLTPGNYFGDGKFYAVNTMQPAYQPSGVVPARDGNALYADPTKATTLPPQITPTIGDLLSEKGVSWKWYGGSWDAAVADGPRDAASRLVIYKSNGNGISTETERDFQAHHQPFNYYAAFDPAAHAAARAAHLKDYNDLVADAKQGTLPAVSFYKPEGMFNQHEGNADLDAGDARIAALIETLRASAQWKDMVIVVTYDEFGGSWDHVAPPKADLLGPGTRIPAIIISPFAKRGTVDHTQYDTGSLMRFIASTFQLPTLRGLATRDSALVRAGGRPMGDLTNALSFR
ncbi:MAG: acid phosphatase [Gemmatimonadaceae bacterium]